MEERPSAVAAHPQVRTLMRAAQRHLGREGAVMEGRDIGSVVFPEAPVKIYLIADARPRRRRAWNEPADGLATRQSLLDQDRRDMKVNVFEPPPGASSSTTDLDVAGTVEAALRLIRERAPELAP